MRRPLTVAVPLVLLVPLLVAGCSADPVAAGTVPDATADSPPATSGTDAGGDGGIDASLPEGSTADAQPNDAPSADVEIPDGGPPSGLDPTFGAGGISVAGAIAMGEVGAAALQPDGKIVMAGTDGSSTGWKGAVVRLLANGALDTSFGDSGKVVLAAGPAQGVAVLPGGKILVGGGRYSPTKGYVARLTAGGQLDGSFGTGGVVGELCPAPGFYSGNDVAMVVQPDGKAVLFSPDGMLPTTFRFARVTAEGQLDASFGTNGVVSVVPSSNSETGFSMALQPDGKILAAATSLVRLNADGTLDTSFATSGVVYSGTYTNALLVHSGGGIVTGGYNGDMILRRFSLSGVKDDAFGQDGVVHIKVDPTLFSSAEALVEQPDGKIAIGGGVFKVAPGSFALARIHASGSLDASFGTGGSAKIVVPNMDTRGRALLLQPDGKLVIVGGDFVAARYGT